MKEAEVSKFIVLYISWCNFGGHILWYGSEASVFPDLNARQGRMASRPRCVALHDKNVAAEAERGRR